MSAADQVAADSGGGEPVRRIESLDLMRGAVMCLLLVVHFSEEFVVFFTDRGCLFSGQGPGGLLGSHYQHLTHAMQPTDFATGLVVHLLFPWNENVFLVLAGFNLAIRDRGAFSRVFGRKMKTWVVVAIFFFFENIARNVEVQWSVVGVDPLVIWMLCLMLVGAVYRYFGIRGVVVLTLLSELRWFVLPESPFIELTSGWVREAIDPIDYYIPNAAIGFVLGYLYHQRRDLGPWRMRALTAVAFAVLATWFVGGMPYPPIDHYDPTEPTQVVFGSLSGGTGLMIGVSVALLALLLRLEERGVRLKVPFLYWMSWNSLLIYGFHRLFLLYIYLPVRTWIGQSLDLPVHNTLAEILIAAVTTIVALVFIKRTRMFEMILDPRSR